MPGLFFPIKKTPHNLVSSRKIQQVIFAAPLQNSILVNSPIN